MKGERRHSRQLLGWIILSFLTFPFSILRAHETQTDTANVNQVYQGMTVKLDLGATILDLIVHKGYVQHYQAGINWRLINRLYPTFEAGYAGTLPTTASLPTRGELTQGDSLHYRGQGGFFRVGLDINPLKKSAATSPHALLVGVRLGTAVQHMRQENTRTAALPYYGTRADCWGEVVAGCQVDVYKGFTMGWMLRMKFLFTRQKTTDRVEALAYPIYIPGYGSRDDMAWGMSYYIGYRF